MDGEGGEEKGRKLNGVGKGKMEQGGGLKRLSSSSISSCDDNV